MTGDDRSYRILVVEDNEGDFILVEDYLIITMFSPELIRAESFEQAKEILTNNQIDAILLDLSLPDMNGEPLINNVSKISGNAPIIILTGYTDVNFAIKSLSLGASDYLLKDDLNPTILYKSIVYSIERNRINLQLKESEHRYAHLFHLSPLPMWVYDIETLAFLDVNKAACEFYCYSPEEFLSMTIRDIRPEKEVATLGNLLKTMDPNTPNTRIVRHRKKSGEIILAEVKSEGLVYNNRKARLVLVNDITEKKRAQEELLTITHQVEDRERTRISLNIHDGLQQTLLASFMHLEALKSEIGPLGQKQIDQFLNGLKILNQGIEQARTIAHELMPKMIEEESYVEALSSLISQNEGAIRFSFKQNLKGQRLPSNIELILFRISQEAINNIIKHSKATEATVSVELTDRDVSLEVADNGIGIYKNTNKLAGGRSAFGLKSIESRIVSIGGSFELESVDDNGTKLKITIPIY